MNGMHGIIFSYEMRNDLRELGEIRSASSIPFGGRYRAVDFALSNLVNAGVTDVGVVLHGRYQSLLDHLGTGKDWDLSRKRGGLKILPPFAYKQSWGEAAAFRGKMEALIRSLARNESTMASNSKLMDDMKEFDNETVSENTLGIYMDVLDRMFLLDPQMAFDPNVRSSIRVGKKPKRHLADPSLAIAAMGLTPRMLLEDLNTYGFMFESMCVRDLRVYAQASGGEVYHYRDDSGMEVDAIVEMPDGQWGAFEIKLGQNQVDAAAEGLLAFRDKMAARTARGAPSVLCVIVGMASYAYRRTDGVFVVPITALGCRDSMMDVEASE